MKEKEKTYKVKSLCSYCGGRVIKKSLLNTDYTDVNLKYDYDDIVIERNLCVKCWIKVFDTVLKYEDK